MFTMSVTLSPSWRDSLGRFASKPVQGAVDAQFPQLARDLVQRLQQATPIRTGRMARGWKSTYWPSRQAVIITDEAPYWQWVAYGTSRMAANPALQRVLASVPSELQVTGSAIQRQIVATLAGG